MNDWHKLHITDKSGKEMFKCDASPMATMSEIHNLKRHIEQAKAQPQHYKFLDAATAVIMLDDVPYSDAPISADELDAMLAELDAML